jgi:hypothetical protein
MLLPTKFQTVTLQKTDLYDYSPGLRFAASRKWENVVRVGVVQVGSKLYVCGVNEPLISELCVGSSNQQIQYVISFISENGINKSVSQFVRPSVCCCCIEVTMLNDVEGILKTRKYCVSIVRYSTFKKDL